jgi:DNA polymerase-3 subunit epsilon
MNLQLTQPLAVFDLETTGVNTSTDRIIEISIHKVHPNGKTETRTHRVNPQIPIPATSTAIHGISNEDVANEPSFEELAPNLYIFLNDCDLAGFNSNKFDVPLLIEEFHRVGYGFDVTKRNLIDVQNIFHKKEPRTLVAAYKFYCDKDLSNAHSAEADTLATYEILEAQLGKYTDLSRKPMELSKFTTMHNALDLAARFVKNDKGIAVFNFGKHKGTPVTEVLTKEPQYYAWMMRGDFSQNTKAVLTQLRNSIKK